MQFEWHIKKNHLNKKKHGLSFEMASFVFEDPFLFSVPDYRHRHNEERWISLGLIQESLIYVAHTMKEDEENGEEIIRIISARQATPSETRRYYANRKNDERI